MPDMVSLKDKNKPLLSIILVANVAIYAVLLNRGFSLENWIETFTDIQKIVPVLVVSIITGILNAQIGHNTKARLVSWRWLNPLPGSRAFTEYASTDPRIDTSALTRHHSPLPTDPREQNALWYKLYREFQKEPAVVQVHREYLYTRDYASIAALLTIGFGLAGLYQIPDLKIVSLYILFLVVQYLLVRRAALNHSIRFVTTVLAYKASSS